MSIVMKCNSGYGLARGLGYELRFESGATFALLRMGWRVMAALMVLAVWPRMAYAQPAVGDGRQLVSDVSNVSSDVPQVDDTVAEPRAGFVPSAPDGDVGGYVGYDNVGSAALGAPLFPGPGPAVMPQPAWVVSGPDFERLLAAINNQTFASNQLPMVQAAGLCGWFTCEQCAAIMACFSFDSNKLQVVRYLAPHIIDPIRCQPIMSQLSFSDDRQTAWRILSEARL